MSGFGPFALAAGGGTLALSPLPGRGGDFTGDLARLCDWRPDLVISLTGGAEMAARGADGLGAALAARGIGWRHLPVTDFGVPGPDSAAAWPALAAEALAVLAAGGRVLVHCHGGCGRSGMVALRLMIGTGEGAEAALARLRAVRPCAVETGAQMEWAMEKTGDTGRMGG